MSQAFAVPALQCKFVKAYLGVERISRKSSSHQLQPSTVRPKGLQYAKKSKQNKHRNVAQYAVHVRNDFNEPRPLDPTHKYKSAKYLNIGYLVNFN